MAHPRQDFAEAPLFDEPSLVDRMFGNADMARQVIGIFVEDCPVRLAEIATAARRHDLQALRIAAHALKGAAGNVSAQRLFEAASALEEIDPAADSADVDAGCRRVSDEARDVLAVFRGRL